MTQTAVEWLEDRCRPKGYITAEEFNQAKEMEKEDHKKTYYQGLNSNFQDFEQYYSETFGTKEQMTREEKLETIVKVFAKIMFYDNKITITIFISHIRSYNFTISNGSNTCTIWYSNINTIVMYFLFFNRMNPITKT